MGHSKEANTIILVSAAGAGAVATLTVTVLKRNITSKARYLIFATAANQGEDGFMFLT